MAIWAGAGMELGPYAPMTHHMGGPLGVDSFLQLNSQGERFMNEDIPGQNIQDQLSRQPGGFSWQILDDKWRDELEAQPTGHGYVNHWMSAEEAAEKPWIMNSVFLGYVTDEVFLNGDPALFKTGITCQADTIEELAEKMELPVDTVVAQIERYNELCDKGGGRRLWQRPQAHVPPGHASVLRHQVRTRPRFSFAAVVSSATLTCMR